MGFTWNSDQVAPVTQTQAKGSLELSITEVSKRWEQEVLPSLAARARARFQAATIVTVAEGRVRFELPNETHRERCEQIKSDIETALRDIFEVEVEVELTAAQEEKVQTTAEPKAAVEEEVVDPAEFEANAGTGTTSVDRVLEAFPGAIASGEEDSASR